MLNSLLHRVHNEVREEVGFTATPSQCAQLISFSLGHGIMSHVSMNDGCCSQNITNMNYFKGFKIHMVF